MTYNQEQYKKIKDVNVVLSRITENDPDYKIAEELVKKVIERMIVNKNYTFYGLNQILKEEYIKLDKQVNKTFVFSQTFLGYLFLGDENISWKNECSGLGKFKKLR